MPCLIRRLLRERRGVLSLQVLQEHFAAATRKVGLASTTLHTEDMLPGYAIEQLTISNPFAAAP